MRQLMDRMRGIPWRLPTTAVSVALALLLATADLQGWWQARHRLLIHGRSAFLAGVNYPWKSYQDFGTGGWGYSGVAQPTALAEIETDFANMAARGIRVVKWRIFNDGRYSPEFDAEGRVTGLDPEFFDDVDAALALAERHDLYLVFTLLSSSFWIVDCHQGAVHIGGHANTVTDPAKRRSLIERAIIPLLKHVGGHPRVVAYEIIAEPEWGIAEITTERDWRKKIPLADVRALVGGIADAIHRYSPALATVEANRPRNMQYWRGVGLDYYSFSWYDWVEPYDPLDVPASQYGLDRSIVIGEFPASGSKYYSLDRVLDVAYRQGYAGAFPWSYWGGDDAGSFLRAETRWLDWIRPRWQEANLGTTNPPGNPPALIPQPFSARVADVQPLQRAITAEIELAVREGGQFTAQFFLHPLDEKPKKVTAQRVVGLRPLAAGRLRLTFADLVPEEIYKLDLGLFDQSGRLQKWFDGLAVFSLAEGEHDRSNLTVRQIEDPCL
ncbi:MAG: hypothetical protein HY331_17530 [Chloroflexi bacterium]|nr:hypothetical protein [Chloroflexota bacterium]